MARRWSDMSRAAQDATVAGLVTGLPILLGYARLYVFARGDIQVFSTLLASMNIVSLIGANLPVVIGWIACVASSIVAARPLGHRPERVRSRIVGADYPFRFLANYFLAAMTLIVAAYSAFLVGVIIFSAGIAAIVSSLRLHRRLRDHQREGGDLKVFADAYLGGRTYDPRLAASEKFSGIGQGVVIAVLVLMFGIGSTSFAGLPIELVRVDGEHEASAGYVVGVDDISLTLAYLDGGVRRIPADDVHARAVCSLDTPAGRVMTGAGNWVPSQSIALLVLDRIAPDFSYVAPECTTTALRRR